MKTKFAILFGALMSLNAMAGTTITCVGPHLLLIETVSDGGPTTPRRGGVVFYKDQLIERHLGEPGEQEVKWEKISTARKPLVGLVSGKKGLNTVVASQESLTVKRTDGQPLLPGEENSAMENVTCSEIAVPRFTN